MLRTENPGLLANETFSSEFKKAISFPCLPNISFEAQYFSRFPFSISNSSYFLLGQVATARSPLFSLFGRTKWGEKRPECNIPAGHVQIQLQRILTVKLLLAQASKVCTRTSVGLCERINEFFISILFASIFSLCFQHALFIANQLHAKTEFQQKNFRFRT